MIGLFCFALAVLASPFKSNDEDQGFHRGLPFGRRVLSFRKSGDVVAGIFERDEGPAARQRYQIIERTLPTAISHLPPSADFDTHKSANFGERQRS